MKWKNVLPALLFVAMATAGLAVYFYYKQPADIRTSTAHYTTTAPALLADFLENETAANTRYLDKIVTVTGTISNIDPDHENPAVFLETGNPMAAVTCSFYNTELATLKSLQTGSVIKIKGVCTGMLTDVVLNKCSIVK